MVGLKPESHLLSHGTGATINRRAERPSDLLLRIIVVVVVVEKHKPTGKDETKEKSKKSDRVRSDRKPYVKAVGKPSARRRLA